MDQIGSQRFPILEHRFEINRLLANEQNVFDGFLFWLSNLHFSSGSMETLKKNDANKRKGKIFEAFCKDWLLASEKYDEVFLLSEVPSDLQSQLGLPKGDKGIDLVARKENKFFAIQVKFRSKPIGRKSSSTVTWRHLSTFISLCQTTGPWERCLVMTNVPNVLWQGRCPPHFSVIKYLNFRNTERIHWMKMAGTFIENKLSEEKNPEKEEIRNLRQIHFS
jgi:hypothetical protein